MNNRRIFLIVFSLICLFDEIVVYYIASKGRYGMACANYVYYCCGIIVFFFVIGLLLTRSSKKSNQNDGNRAEIRFNMPYAVTIAVALIAFVYYTFIFYNMKEPVGHIAVGILIGFFILLVLLNVYYGLSKKYVNNEDYMLQLLSFVGVGGLVCLIMAQHHVFNTINNVYISKFQVFAAYAYVIILTLIAYAITDRKSKS